MTRWILSACLVAMLGTFKGSVSEELGFRHVARADAERPTSAGGTSGAWSDQAQNVQTHRAYSTDRVSPGDATYGLPAPAGGGQLQSHAPRTSRPLLQTLVASLPRLWPRPKSTDSQNATQVEAATTAPRVLTSADIRGVFPPTWEDVRPIPGAERIPTGSTAQSPEREVASLPRPSVPTGAASFPDREKSATDYGADSPTRLVPGTEGADDLMEHPLFRSYYDTALKYYQGRARSTVRAAATRYAGMQSRMEPLFTSSDVPSWIIGVAVVEAGLNPAAVAPSGHAGMWQLGGDTARKLGLTVGRGRDERLDAVASTRAALKLLSDLYRRYGDWPLALAAYNLGAGRVDRALARRPGACLCQLVDRGLLPDLALQNVARYFAASVQMKNALDSGSARTVAASPL